MNDEDFDEESSKNISDQDISSLDKIDIFTLHLINTDSADLWVHGDDRLKGTEKIADSLKYLIKSRFDLSRAPIIKKNLRKLIRLGLIKIKGESFRIEMSRKKIGEIIDSWFSKIIPLKPYKDTITISQETEHHMRQFIKKREKELENQREELDKLKTNLNELILDKTQEISKSVNETFGSKIVAKAIIAYLRLTPKQRVRIPYILAQLQRKYEDGREYGWEILYRTHELDPRYPDDKHIIKVLDMKKIGKEDHRDSTYYSPKDKQFAKFLLDMCVTDQYPIDFMNFISRANIILEIDEEINTHKDKVESLKYEIGLSQKELETLKKQIVQLTSQKSSLIREITIPMRDVQNKLLKIDRQFRGLKQDLGAATLDDIQQLLFSFEPTVKNMQIKVDYISQTSKRVEHERSIRDEKEYSELFEIYYPEEIERSIDDLILPKRITKIVQYISLLREKNMIDKFKRAGVTGYNKILLAGASGTGKTVFAKACARDLNLDLLLVKTHQVVNKYLGDTSKNIAKVLQFAREKAPCLILWDEIDNLLVDRKSQTGSTSTEMRRALNTLLTEVEKVTLDDQIFLFFATNLPEELDQAFHRRVSETVIFEIPSKNELKEIYELYLEKIEDKDEINTDKLVEESYLFTGGNVKQVLNKSFNNAMIEKRSLNQQDIIEAIKEIKSGLDISNQERVQKQWRVRVNQALGKKEKTKIDSHYV